MVVACEGWSTIDAEQWYWPTRQLKGQLKKDNISAKEVRFGIWLWMDYDQQADCGWTAVLQRSWITSEKIEELVPLDLEPYGTMRQARPWTFYFSIY